MDIDFIVLRDPRSSHTIPGDGEWQDGIIGEQSPGRYNNAAFFFKKRKPPFLWVLMEDFVERYDGDAWGNQGPMLFKRVFDARCKPSKQSGSAKKTGIETEKEKAVRQEQKWEGCPSIWRSEVFYPIHHRDIDTLFERLDLAREEKEEGKEREDAQEETLKGNNNGGEVSVGQSSSRRNVTWQEPESLTVHLWNKMSARKEKDYCLKRPLEYFKTTVARLRAQYCPRSFNGLQKDCLFLSD